MQIKDFSRNNVVTHDRLSLSDVFKFNDRVFMKVSEAYTDDLSNSYDFTKERLTQFSPDTEVEHVQSTLVLHGKDWSEIDERQ